LARRAGQLGRDCLGNLPNGYGPLFVAAVFSTHTQPSMMHRKA
jgi:hypothetical protein